MAHNYDVAVPLNDFHLIQYRIKLVLDSKYCIPFRIVFSFLAKIFIYTLLFYIFMFLQKGKPNVVNILFFFLFNYLTIFIHEIGHVIAGRLVGFDTSIITIGQGKEIGKIHLFGIEIIYRSTRGAWLAGTRSFNHRATSNRLLLLYLGGYILQIIPLLILIIFFKPDIGIFFSKTSIDIASSFIFASLISIIFNLIPGYIKSDGDKIENDILKVIFLITRKRFLLRNTLQRVRYSVAFNLFKDKKYDEAEKLCIYYEHLFKELSHFHVLHSVILIKQIKTNEAIQLLIPRIEHEKSNYVKGICCNNIAFANLLEFTDNSVLLADEYSEKAMSYLKEMKDIPDSVVGTRACSLILNKKYYEGVDMIKDLYIHGSPKMMLFVAYSFFMNNNGTMVKKCLKLVGNRYNVENYKIDADEMHLINNLLKNTNMFTGNVT